MTEPCIDCGEPAETGSSWCAPCNAPIPEAPRKLLRDWIKEQQRPSDTPSKMQP